MVAPNIVNVATITGKTATLALTTSGQVIVTNPGSSGKVLKINSVIAANVDGTNARTVDVYHYDSDSTVSTYVASTITIPADASLVVLSKETSMYLEEGASLRALADSAFVDVICSYEEIS